MGLRLPLDVSTYWKQHLLSDINVSIELASSIDQNATPHHFFSHKIKPHTSVLRKIPAHRVVLGSSPYFKAQVRQTIACDICLNIVNPGTGNRLQG